MRSFIRRFLGNQMGQDVVEYSLILAFICLAGAAMYIGMANNTQGLWTAMNTRLANANQSGS